MCRLFIVAQAGGFALFLSMLIAFSAPAFALDNKLEVKDSPVESRHRFPTHMTLEEAAEYEKVVPEKAVFSEALRMEGAFTPGSTALPSALAGPSGLFNGIFAGNTTYDYQHNGTCHRQIQHGLDRDTGKRFVHVSWMVLKSQNIMDPNRQVNYNCYEWGKMGGPGWRMDVDSYGGIAIIESGERGGYAHIDVNKVGNAVAFHHSAGEGATPYSRCVRFAIPGLGTYTADRLISLSGQINIWPNGAVGDDTTTVPPARHAEYDVYHVVAQDYTPAANDPAVIPYWRYCYDDMHGKFRWQGPVPMGVTMTLSQLVVAQGTRVVVVFGKPRNIGEGRNQYDNDLAYYESNLAGADWIAAGGPPVSWENGGGWNVTDYADSDMHRFYIDITGGFDSEGRLHLAYNNPAYDDVTDTVSVGPCELLHWSETIPGGNGPAVPSPGPDAGFNGANFHIVTSAMWGTDGTPGNVGSSGAWNRYVSKICLAFGDGSTVCDGQPNLDYLYMTYCQDGSPDPLDKADASAASMQNSNIWLSISNDKGFSWAAPECISTTDGLVGGTPTRTPGCDPATGDTCLSEDWQSNAKIVNDTLHVFYVGDLDAGGVVQGEGSWRINDLMYLPIFGGTNGYLCPCDCGVWGDVNDDGEINPVDVVYMVNYVYKNDDMRIQPPDCYYEAGDVTCDEQVNPVDAVHYVNYVYKNITPWPCGDPCSP